MATHDKLRRQLPDWLLEGLFIVLSVALAFGVDEYRESRADRQQASRALKSLQSELEHNLAAIEPFVRVHQQWANALRQAAAPTAKTGLELYGSTQPPLPEGSIAEYPTEVRRGAWDAALSTGALRLIDYDLVAGLSEIYESQRFLGERINIVVSAVNAPAAFDPANGARTAGQMALGMGSVAFAEQLVLDLYRKNLPAVRAAASRP